MAVRPVLLLGDDRLYRTAEPIGRDELAGLGPVIADLRDTLLDFRRRHGAGRAVAAPQIGLAKRLIFCSLDDGERVIINPGWDFLDPELVEVWDDCMSFPGLWVKVRRHATARLTYRDLDWAEQTWDLNRDLAELLQHEYDHLDGILAVQRAMDEKSLSLIPPHGRFV